MAEQPSEQLMTILDNYCREAEAKAKGLSQVVAKEAAKKLKETSPKKTGDYAKGWGVVKQGDVSIVRNARAPGLTHLLEKGHLIRNKKGTFGRAPAHVHIAPVEKWGIEEFEERLRRELS